MNEMIDNLTKPGTERIFPRFLRNLIKERTITVAMAETLAELKTPHLQLEALMRLRLTPERGLPVIVSELQKEEALKDADQSVKKTPLLFEFNANFRLGLFFALTFGVVVLIIRTAGSWFQFSAPRSMPSPSTDPKQEIVINTSVQKPVLFAGPQNLTATVLPSGMVHLMWDPLAPTAKYRLFMAKSEDMQDAERQQPDKIPMNWLDWMPPTQSGTMWLAICQVHSDGLQSPLSKPALVSPPSPAP